jgi:hypothetical protein
LGLTAAGTVVELLEPATELVNVDADDRILRNVELGAASERLYRDVDLLRGFPENGAFDQVIEESAELPRAT